MMSTAAATAIKDRLNPDTIIKNTYGGYQRHSPRFILGYWSIRGLGAPIRMLLSAAQIDHWVVMYDVMEGDDDSSSTTSWDKSSWEKDKRMLKKDFPFINLPYLIDCAEGEGGKVLCQTNAILTYLGSELKMMGQSPWKMSQCEELLCEIMDLRNLMVRFAYKKEEDNDSSTILFQEEAHQLLVRADSYFQKFEQHLITQYPDVESRIIQRDELNTIGFYMNGICHLIGGKFSAPDFHLWEMLQQFEGLCTYLNIPNCIGDATTYSKQVDELQTWLKPTTKKVVKYPYLKEFSDNFIHLFGNQAYGTMFRLNGVNSPRAIRLPYNNAYARFGSKPEVFDKSRQCWIIGKYVRGEETPWKRNGVIKNSHTRINTGIEYWDDEAQKTAKEYRDNEALKKTEDKRGKY